ncbi:MAG: NADH-quinone oxidoreductase subunit N [Verrucomicrobiota bacterium JB023]|nr:NADH-quinone oxidoreductase subunit N [Verrucomicrobiota bacterium JB023]
MNLQLHHLEILVVALGIIILMAEAFFPRERKSFLGWIAIGGLLAIFGLLFVAEPATGDEISRAYASDRIAKFFKGFTLIITALVILMAIDYKKVLSRFTENPGREDGIAEYFALPLFACAGMMWMASAKDLVTAFAALELTTITFYILVAYMRRNVGSLEAGIKYLILGALSTGFLVYGIAWIYGGTGSMNLEVISTVLDEQMATETRTAILFGLALILVALAFKVGAAPMHLWIPDVYQGAPTPTTTFLSVGSKAVGFIVALRILQPFLDSELTKNNAVIILSIIAAATLLIGNLAAIAQTNLKRLLAYSSIANAGFILLAVAAWQPASENALSSPQVVAIYLATYLVMTVAAFFALQSIAQSTGTESIASLAGLGKTHPALAWTLTIIFAALAGLPLTVGFIGKFFAFGVAVKAGLWLPVIVAFIGVTAGFYYYFKVIRTMFWNPSANGPEIYLSPITKAVVYPSAALIIILGVYAQPLLDLVGA